MRRSIRAVVFDIGDVLFTPLAQANFYACWEQRLCITPGSLSRSLWHGPDIEAADVGLITAEEYCRRCAARLSVNEGMLIDEGTVLTLIEDAFSGQRLNDALINYIQTLRPYMQIVALTNNWSFGRRLIERRGITKLFDLIVTSAEAGMRKPDPRIYQITWKRLGITPEEAVFVDNSIENIEAAQGLGIHSVHFRSTEQAISELDALLFDHRE